MFRQQISLASVATALALSTVSSSSAVSSIVLPVLAQSSGISTSFPVPQSVPNGTQVQINGTPSMEKINQALAQQFKAKFPGTEVNIGYDGTDASVQALGDGKIDVAAIGRSLTQVEQARGIATVPISRNKIAVIIGKDNPFNSSLTSEQFARIFRGEITNWSQVGGAPQAIRLIDRPENSDLRQALQNYPVFQKAPFQTGANAVKLTQDTTEAVIKQLGADGIGYAIVDQAINNPNVQVVPLHNVPPTDPRYPFSQPLGYAYQKANPSPAAAAFLGYATAPENQQIIEQARAGNAIAAPKATPSPTTEATPSPATTPATTATTESQGEFPWWWLLLIPLLGLGGLLWWLSRRTTAPTHTPVAAPVPAAPVSLPESRIILTPRNCKNAYAYWEIPNQVKADLQQQGGHKLKLRLYDVTDIDMDRQTPHSTKEFDCDPQAQDLHIPITTDNRDYVAELGYVNHSNRWLKIARSAPVRVPACKPVVGIPTVVAANSLVSDRPVTKDESRLIMVPRNSKDAYVYWEVPEARKAELRQQGGQQLALRVYDTTGIDLEQQPAHRVREIECDEQASDLHIPIAESDRDYVAELGYVTADARWLKLARSAPVKVPYTFSQDSTARLSNDGANSERVENISKATTNIAGDIANQFGGTIAGGTAAVAGIGEAARSFVDRGQSNRGDDVWQQAAVHLRTDDTQPTMKGDCRIILVPRNSGDAYAYWEISDEYKEAARQQGGRRLMLRVHDVTNLDIDNQQAHSTQEYRCDEHDQDKHISIPVSDRDYIAEIGYYTDENRWLRIIRSFHVHVPSDKGQQSMRRGD
ncbi:extracellular solute-binding protein [Chlorogloeopsis sp. ULAP02]|uniref:extracellular solute-binding protein n=1 Tax=Chlorogloeopsis sp. ULAP02 TaxID=3107926 RepID=UPI003134C2A6